MNMKGEPKVEGGPWGRWSQPGELIGPRVFPGDGGITGNEEEEKCKRVRRIC